MNRPVSTTVDVVRWIVATQRPEARIREVWKAKGDGSSNRCQLGPFLFIVFSVFFPPFFPFRGRFPYENGRITEKEKIGYPYSNLSLLEDLAEFVLVRIRLSRSAGSFWVFLDSQVAAFFQSLLLAFGVKWMDKSSHFGDPG